LSVIGGGLWWAFDRRYRPPKPLDVGSLDQALQMDSTMPLSFDDTDVVIAIICTFRRDRLSVYGHDRETTPFLDKLGAHGVVMDMHFSQAPWTRPSVGSIVTGRWPRALQVDLPGEGNPLEMVMGEEHTLLAEVFAERGYHTVGAIANPNALRRFGFAQGFSNYREPERAWAEGGTYLYDANLVEHVIDYADGLDDDERLYARLLMITTHTPRDVTDDDIAQFADGQPARLAEYDAAAYNLDLYLAELYTALKARRPNLLFVVAADHGEGLFFPRHHGPGHGNFLYQTALRVPWIVQHPSLPAGRRVDGFTMNIDVHPTVLGLLGAAAAHRVDGRDQSAVIRGETDNTGHERVFAETFFRDVDKATLFERDYHLVKDYGSGSVRQFRFKDWRASRAMKTSPRRVEQEQALDAWRTEQSALVTAPGQTAPLDENTRSQLEVMGYLE
ncbi:MAG: sulfatase-like hydrolase/transferase, partial [Myxococcota bacterium]